MVGDSIVVARCGRWTPAGEQCGGDICVAVTDVCLADLVRGEPRPCECERCGQRYRLPIVVDAQTAEVKVAVQSSFVTMTKVSV